MSGVDPGSHEQHAEQLRARVADTGLSSRQLRLGALARDRGGPAIPEPYEALVDQVAGDSARVTDAQVRAVREAAGSEKAAFEIILTAAIGAGLHRWESAAQVIVEAGNAAP